MQDVFTQISVILAASGVIFAVVYYFFYLRNVTKVRKSDTFMRLFTHINTDAFQDADMFQIKHRYEKIAPIVKQLRKELNEPRYIEWFEYLYNWYLKQETQRRFRQDPIYLKKP